MNTNELRPASLLCALLLAVVGPAHAAPGDDVPLAESQIKALGIVTDVPASTSTERIGGLGARVSVPARHLHVVSAPLSGLVESVAVSADERVRAGDRIARLRSPALAEAQRAYLQAATQLSLARDNLARDQKLLDEGIIAESRLRATRAAHAEAAAVYAERRQVLRLAGMTDAGVGKLGQGRGIDTVIDLKAPVDGVVLERTASVGQRVEAYAPIFKIAKVDVLQLDIQVPAARLAGVSAGDAVAVESADAHGRVVSVARSVDPDSQTATVRAVMDRNADRLRVGQNVEAVISRAGGTPGAWRVPREAVVRIDRGAVVWLRTGTGFRPVEVRIVHEDAGTYDVEGPLAADARIAVKGASTLKARRLGVGSS